MLRKILLALTLIVLPVIANAQLSDNGLPVKPVGNADVSGITYWSNDTVWNMTEKVYVEDGEVLIIQAGTIIKADAGSGSGAVALIVTRGGKLYAEGTQTQPIIFTSIDDDIDDPLDIPLPPNVLGRGLWGGLIVLGKATIADPAGENYIEGVDEIPEHLYGGSDDNDNSGVLRYVSIRHGGSVLGFANEINGLTMGGVGRGTVVDHIEIFANVDDGVEIFGGTVNISHIVCAFGGDDQIDYDEGWRGMGQFIFTIADTLDSDTYGEHDGAVSPEDQTPYSTPLLSNVTAIGAGSTSAPINERCFGIRDNAGGAYYNSFFAHHKGYGIGVEDLGSGHDSRERLSVGDLHFENNYFFDIQGGLFQVAETWVNDSIFSGVPAFGNVTTDPGFSNIDWQNNGLLDPRPSNAGTWTDPTAFAPPANPALTWSNFFQTVNYMGAFDPNEDLWTCGWTFLWAGGYTVDCAANACGCTTDNGKPVKTVANADIVDTVVWYRDTVYNMTEKIYVDAGEVLIIEPGTIVKADAGSGSGAVAIIVTRGGKIYSLGSQDCPVVFTSIDDDVDDPLDIPLPPNVLGRGLWGGVIVLGNATIADPAGENYIEGVDEIAAHLYGGVDDNDNSGVIKFTSIRHGGSVLGFANEINGLTMGGVGRGTVVDGVEIFANVDDGIEIFGGTVNISHVICAFGGDDQIDYDEGWRGAGQFIFTIADTLDSDTYGEHDGAVSPEDQTPYSTPLLSNVTGIGAGPTSAPINERAFGIRDNAGGGYFNSIFAHHKGYGIGIEDLGSGHDSRERLSVGDLHFENNFFFDIKGGLFQVAETWVDDSVFSGVPAWNNVTTDPQFNNIDWQNNAQLDPVPDAAGPAVGTWLDPVANFNPPANPALTWSGFFKTVNYMGAFDPTQTIEESWAYGWSFLTCGGYFGSSNGSGGCCTGIRGNANGDPEDKVNISDVTYLTSYLFGIPPGSAPPCLEEGNANGDPEEKINISDVTYLTAYLFGIPAGSAPPSCP